jgi:UDP-N-acetylmuramoyl-tripeptide--D-alanyl-D-alanine ligase
MSADIDIAVIEMGASAAGEIDYLCSVAKPDVALINNAQTAHIEGFGSIEAIAKAKAEIYSGLESDGIAILNADEIWSKGWSDIIGDRSCLRFSVEDDSADIFAKEISEAGSGCYSFILCLHPRLGSISGEQFLKLTMPGLHAVSNALAAAACAVAVGSNLSSIITGLSAVRSVPGRLQRFKLENSYTVIDDSYNANPNSFETAIDVLCCCDGHRVVVMGDMGELGNYAEEAHQNIGRYAKNLGIDSFLGVGALSKIATDAFGGDHFQNQDQLLDALAQKIDLLNIPATEVTILVKGSRSSHMEGIAQALINQESMPC